MEENNDIKYVDLDGLSHFKAKTDNEYVKKVAGKGLSTEDYTTAEKTKLAGLSNYDDTEIRQTLNNKADASDIPTTLAELTGDTTHRVVTDAEKTTWNAKSDFSGDYNDLSNKPTIPTNNNQLVNGAGYQTASDVNTAISDALADITGIDFQVVQTLPATGEKGVIYLVSHDGIAPDIYDEYIWVNNAFEKIGTTAIDLTNYVQFSDLTPITNAEIDTIFNS